MKINNTDFINCNLDDGEINEVSLSKVEIKNTSIRNTNINKTNLKDIDFRSCDISKTIFSIDSLKGIIVTPYQALNLSTLLGIQIGDEI